MEKAYIVAQNKFSSVSSGAGYSDSKQHNSIAQNAYWQYTTGSCYLGGNNTSVKNLLKKAADYKAYHNGFKALAKLSKDADVKKEQLSNGNTVFGPYKYQYTTSSWSKITSFVVNGKQNGANKNLTQSTDYYFSTDKAGKNKVTKPAPNTNFYLVVKAKRNIEEINKITISEEHSVLSVYYWYLERSKGSSGGQNLFVSSPSWETKKSSIDFPGGTVEIDVKVKLYKKTFNNKGLKGAQIEVTAVDNVSFTKKTLTSAEKGYFGQIVFNPTDTSKNNFTIRVKETKAPGGASDSILNKSIDIKVTYDKTTGKVTKTTLSTSGLSDYVTCSAKSGIGLVTIKNNSELPYLVIDKADTSGNAVPGAEFTVLIKNVKSVQINETYFPKDENGNRIVNVDTTLCSKSGPKDNYYTITAKSNQIRLYRVTTRKPSEGYDHARIVFRNVEFADKATSMGVTIKETKAPKGYKLISGCMRATITPVEDGLYVGKVGTIDSTVKTSEFDRKNGVETGKYASSTFTKNAAGGNYIRMFVKDIPENPNLELKLRKINPDGKVLSGAILEVVKGSSNISSISGLGSDGKTIKSNSKGAFPKLTVKLSNNTGEIKLKVKETKPLSVGGVVYKQINNGNEFTLTIKYDKDTKEVTSVSGCSDIKWNKENGTIDVVNTPKDDSPMRLKLIKVDASGTVLEGATIKISKNTNIKSMKFNGTEKDSVEIIKKGVRTSGEVEIVPQTAGKMVKLDIEETEVPDEMEGFAPNRIGINIDANGKPTSVVNKPFIYSSDITGNLVTIKIKNTGGKIYPDIPVEIVKYDKLDHSIKLEDATFDVEVKTRSGSKILDEEITTDSDGIASAEIPTSNSIKNGNKSFNLAIKEIEAPEGYALPENPNFNVSFSYNESTGKFSIDSKNCEAKLEDGTLKLKIEIENTKCLKLDLTKFDNLDGLIVQGAKFDVTTTNVDYYYIENTKVTSSTRSITTDSNGEIHLDQIVPSSNNDVKITFKETEAPNGLHNAKEFSVVWKYEGGEFVLQDPEVPAATEDDEFLEVEEGEEPTDAVVTMIEDNKMNEFVLKKIDSFSGQLLPNVEFSLEFDGVKSLEVHKNCLPPGGFTGTGDYMTISEDMLASTTFVTDSAGEIKIRNVILADKEGTIGITETKKPEDPKDGSYYYADMEDTIYFDFVYNEFGKTSGGITLTGPYLDDEGTKIMIGHIEKDITDVAKGSANNYTANIELKNYSLIDLEGQVWKEHQEGDKKIVGDQGDGAKAEDEELVEGVNVFVYTAGGQDLTQNFVEEGETVVKTDGEGKYLFEGLERTSDGYKIAFEYNGIDYKSTKFKATGNDLTDSDADENLYTNNDGYSRPELNNRFKTIYKGKSNDETEMKYDVETEEYITTSDLLVEIDGCNIAYGEEHENEGKPQGNYKVRAFTNAYTTTQTLEGPSEEKPNKVPASIDLGLVEKYFDLELTNIATNIEYTINSQNMKFDTGVTENSNNPAENIYDASVYSSDYYYRFDDYGGMYENYEDYLNNQINNEGEEDGKIKRSDVIKDDSELNIYLIYTLKIDNTSGNEASNVEVKYTFPSEYLEFTGVNHLSSGSTIDDSNKDNGELIFNLDKNDINKSSQNNIELLFKMKKNDEDNRSLPREMTQEGGLTVNNIAEIMSYTTTEGGYVDNDSEPGNGEEFELEDDFNNYAVTFTLQEQERIISGNVAEAIKTEDGNKILSDDEAKQINNVTVQLVERVKYDDNTYLEYIWQETQTGSNKVKARRGDDADGDDKPEVYIYDNNLLLKEVGSVEGEEGAEEGTVENPEIKGQYRFLSYSKEASYSKEGQAEQVINLNTGFIPGKNYFVRFIYGDGTVYDAKLENGSREEYMENISKYNGQDYKSTIDYHYSDKWYNIDSGKILFRDAANNENFKYKSNESTARDNEARRLEVMAFSSKIGGGLGEALAIIEKDSFDSLNDREQTLIREYYDEVESDTWRNWYETKYDFADLDKNSDAYKFNYVKAHALENTWMSAETSLINIPIITNTDEGYAYEDPETGELITIEEEHEMIPVYESVNLGLELRPQTKLELEKHITGMRIRTNAGKTIVDAKVDPARLEDYLINGDEPTITGEKSGLSAIRSRRGNRGFWKVETDIEEIAQGATLEVEYTYVVKDVTDEANKDYLSKILTDDYVDSIANYNSIDGYNDKLNGHVASIKQELLENEEINGNIGTYLGEFYYTGEQGDTDVEVLSRVENITEYLNKDLGLRADQYKAEDNTRMDYFEAGKANTGRVIYLYDVDGNLVPKPSEPKESWPDEKTIVLNHNLLEAKDIIGKEGNYSNPVIGPGDAAKINKNNYSKKVWLSKVIDGSSKEFNFPSYIAEITEFTNTAGRRNMVVTPSNLLYAHSNDTNKVLEAKYVVEGGSTTFYWNKADGLYILNPADKTEWQKAPDGVQIPVNAKPLNEIDEFWGESVLISKPTGNEDKSFPVQTVVIVSSAVVLLGVGIVLIKKYAIKK